MVSRLESTRSFYEFLNTAVEILDYGSERGSTAAPGVAGPGRVWLRILCRAHRPCPRAPRPFAVPDRADPWHRARRGLPLGAGQRLGGRPLGAAARPC